MDKIAILFFAFALFSFNSCGSDEPEMEPEECIPGTFEETIVGSWDTPQLNPSVPVGEVIFNADGTATTTDGSAFDRGDLEFDWTYNNTDSVLMVGIYIYEMLELKCDEIILETVGADFTITRQE